LGLENQDEVMSPRRRLLVRRQPSLGLTETRELGERGRPILFEGKLYLGISTSAGILPSGDFVEAMHFIVQNEIASDLSSAPAKAIRSQNSGRRPFGAPGSIGPNTSQVISLWCERSIANIHALTLQNFPFGSAGIQKVAFPG
jgi:hypothetical protein